MLIVDRILFSLKYLIITIITVLVRLESQARHGKVIWDFFEGDVIL